MKTAQHTPGPWRNEGATVKAISHGICFKITRADANNYTTEGNEANARLIAAAPDLLAALQEIEDKGKLWSDNPDQMPIGWIAALAELSRNARYAIAKATGGTE